MQNGGVQVGSVPRTMSSAVMLGNAPLGGQYQDSLESLDQATWQGLASHARGFDLTSPEVQEQIDVTDARLKSIFDAFDQDWDGTLTRNELLQGLAQQGFPGLDGTSAFEALWEACDKSGGKAKGVVEQDQHHREYCITFDAFKRIVQRLKTEVLFLPDLHPGCSGLFAGLDVGMSSRASTPVPGLLGPPPSSLLRPHLPPHGASSLNYYPQPAPPSSSSSAPYKPSTLSGSSGLPPRYGSTMVMAGPVAAAAGSTSTSPYQQQHAMMGGAAEESKWPFEGARFSYVDYNEKKYRAEIPVQDPYSFFTAHRDSSDFIMRWLHLEGADRLNILRLGVKYSVHPLAVEDSLKLDEQQPKVNAYGSHYFIVVPFFRLARESREGMEALRQQRRHHSSNTRGGSIDGGKVGDAIPSVRAALLPRDPSLTERPGKDALRGGGDADGGRAPLDVQVEWSKLCLFVAGPPLFDTVISIHTKWEPFNAPPREDVPYGGGGSGEAGGQPMLAPHRHVFESIVNQLKVDYSTLRQGNSKQLLYRILDEVVDNIQPITRAYRMRVRHFQDQLQQPDFNFTKEEIKDLINMKSELQRLQRRMRPITSVIRHLMEDNNVGKDIKVYLDDVAEHVVRGLEEISGCIEMVDSTKEESRSLREQRGNEVLYTLTIITSIFVPLQFLTGIYGMNFVDRTGHPSMPELTWQYGYAYFWLLAGAILVCLISYFRFVKRWL